MTAAYGRRAGDSDLIDPGPPRAAPPQRLAFSQFGMVSSAHHLATQIGAGVLESGGNAVDAAVATAFALGVCEPQASGLGGQTAMLIHIAEPRRTFALDGSSRAPNRVVPGSLKKRQRRRGYQATTVPATPACLGYALRTYGTMTLADILEPSIALAEDGFAWSTLQRDLSRRAGRAPAVSRR
ncbi:MAG: gamma-glutamyltransferase [Planctomycetota bacterium]|jgi:gamma-glutamyltranspeptidase/glutathione hydrolase